MNYDSALVTGGSGMIGKNIPFGKKPSHRELDITDPRAVDRYFAKHKPKLVLHLAAITDKRLCETDPVLAYRVNVLGTTNIAVAARAHKAKMVYLSTSYVFSGKRSKPYAETDTPDPLNVYGKTKFIGELAAQDIAPGSLVIRTGLLFGGVLAYDKSFVAKTAASIMAGNDVREVTDRYCSLTSVDDLNAALKTLLKKNASGIYHVINAGEASYFDIANEMANHLHAKKVKKLSAASLTGSYIPRGGFEVMSSKTAMRPWQKALRAYLDILQ